MTILSAVRMTLETAPETTTWRVRVISSPSLGPAPSSASWLADWSRENSVAEAKGERSGIGASDRLSLERTTSCLLSAYWDRSMQANNVPLSPTADNVMFPSDDAGNRIRFVRRVDGGENVTVYAAFADQIVKA